MKLLCRTGLLAALSLASLPGFAASADELILACEKLQRAEDRSTCLKEAVRASAGAPAGFSANSSASSSARSKPASRKDIVLSAADSIMRSLRRMNSATSVGITMRDYSQLVVTESAIIEEALRSVPRGPFEDNVRRARDAYIDARKVWSIYFESTYASIFEISISPILRRYEFDTSSLGKTPMGMEASALSLSRYLTPIWSAAAGDEKAAEAAMASIMNPPSPAQPSTPISTSRPAPVSTPAALTPAPTAVQRTPETAARRQATPDDQRVLLALNRLDGLADTGPGLNEYAKLSTSGVAEVDAALGNIPNDAFRNKVLAARQAYVDAHQVWYWAEQYQYLSQFADAAGPTLRTYGVGPGTMNSTGIKEMRLMPKRIFLFPIWSAARIHIDAAEALLSSPEAAKPLPNKLEAPADVDSSRSAAALRKAEEIRKAEELRNATGQGKAGDQGKANAQPSKQAP